MDVTMHGKLIVTSVLSLGLSSALGQAVPSGSPSNPPTQQTPNPVQKIQVDGRKAPGSLPQTDATGKDVAVPDQSTLTREQIAAKLETILKQPPATGLLVFGVTPAGQSHKRGVQVGDILTHYDAQEVRTTNELRKFAQAASTGNRKPPIIALFQRGDKQIDVDFDLAPLGLRLTPVSEGQSRTLWRPDTPYTPDLSFLDSWSKAPLRYEIITRGEKVIGYRRNFLIKDGSSYVLRTQTRFQVELIAEAGKPAQVINDKYDILIRFEPTPNLGVLAVRIQAKEKVVLDLRRQNGMLAGKRFGIDVKDEYLNDSVSALLAPLVACSMPAKDGTCRRISYLDQGSLVAAPFADLAYLGVREFENGGEKSAPMHVFETTVFGKRETTILVNDARQVVQTEDESGVRSTMATTKHIERYFKDISNDFQPIEKLPVDWSPNASMAQ